MSRIRLRWRWEIVRAEKRLRQRRRDRRLGRETIEEKLARWRLEGKLAKPPAGATVFARDFVVLPGHPREAWLCPVTMEICLPECTGMCARQLQALARLAAEGGQELVLETAGMG